MAWIGGTMFGNVNRSEYDFLKITPWLQRMLRQVRKICATYASMSIFVKSTIDFWYSQNLNITIIVQLLRNFCA